MWLQIAENGASVPNGARRQICRHSRRDFRALTSAARETPLPRMIVAV